MVSPGARKPSVGEGIESSCPLICSFSPFMHLLCFYTPLVVCISADNNNNNKIVDLHSTSLADFLVTEIQKATVVVAAVLPRNLSRRRFPFFPYSSSPIYCLTFAQV